jgi:hypothetical protein
MHRDGYAYAVAAIRISIWLLAIALLAVLMIPDNSTPHRRLGVERLAMLVIGHFSSRPTDLRPILLVTSTGAANVLQRKRSTRRSGA